MRKCIAGGPKAAHEFTHSASSLPQDSPIARMVPRLRHTRAHDEVVRMDKLSCGLVLKEHRDESFEVEAPAPVGSGIDVLDVSCSAFAPPPRSRLFERAARSDCNFAIRVETSLASFRSHQQVKISRPLRISRCPDGGSATDSSASLSITTLAWTRRKGQCANTLKVPPVVAGSAQITESAKMYSFDRRCAQSSPMRSLQRPSPC
mmetsp:Transcript_62333/g.110428  ORF Transcript_62333/g.110428 Transcript_62333/m.110428 type:complete len:205 (+) Transcript_62333:235-849(+)